MEEADARREARRTQHIHEKPRSVGGTVDYSTAVIQKQKAVTAATTGLEIQVTYVSAIFVEKVTDGNFIEE